MKTIIINIIFFLAFFVTFSQVVNDNETNFPQEGSINESIWNSYLIQGIGSERTVRLGVSNDNYTRGEIEIENNNTSGGSIYLKTTNTNGGAVERMFIGSNGNVGIGTTSPGEKLHVNGLIRIPSATNEDNNSPGIVAQSNDDFLYDGQYLNHYGFGFHGYQDGSTTYVEPMNTYMSGYFGVDFFTGGQNRMRISRDGIVSIGTVYRPSGYKLAVAGKMITEEVKVALQANWPDYVFNNDYKLPTLKEVEQHIKDKGHLKDIPSAEEVKENGIFLGEMNSKLLQKIEELTLYTINQEKRIEALESKNEKLLLLVEKLLNKKIEK